MAFDWMRFVALLCIPHFYWIYCTLYYEIIIKKWISFVGISPSISFVHWRFCKPLANILALLAAMQKLFKHFFFALISLLTSALHCVNYMLPVYNNFFQLFSWLFVWFCLGLYSFFICVRWTHWIFVEILEILSYYFFFVFCTRRVRLWNFSRARHKKKYAKVERSEKIFLCLLWPKMWKLSTLAFLWRSAQKWVGKWTETNVTGELMTLARWAT